MPGFAQQRQAGTRHPHEAKHVGLPHADPLIVVGLLDRVETQGSARVVDEHVDASESFPHLAHELADAFLIGDVEMQGHAVFTSNALQAIDPARSDHHSVALTPECDRGRRPDPRRSPRDHRNWSHICLFGQCMQKIVAAQA